MIVLATHNNHKVEEITLLVKEKWTHLTLPLFSTLSQLDDVGALPETKETLVENAVEKATYVYDHFHNDCLAEDSGLEVFALNGDPGVRSARYAGEERDAKKNIELLLKNLDGVNDRRARFVAVMALYYQNELFLFQGVIDGTITTEIRGNGGFGYDPVFIPVGHEITFAQMNTAQKSRISHRYRALEKVVQFLESKIKGTDRR